MKKFENFSDKNKTRISSLLGTWTIEFKIKADIGDYKTSAFLTMYAMCDDQLSGNSCSLPDCIEYDSNVCTRTTNNTESCHLMNETLVDWSDAMIFIYMEFKADIGYPYNDHYLYTTGGWVGPYSVIFAQNKTAENETFSRDKENQILDTYELKYLKSQSTPYLKMPTDCNIFETYPEFSRYLGEETVDYTTSCQASGLPFEDLLDPFYKTCDNGSVKPLLPYATFTFVKKNNTEEILVKFSYKLLIYPIEGSSLYNAMSSIEKEVGIVSGPFCFEGDPNRGWTFDLEYDSSETDNGATLHHSCVDNFPCQPPSITNCNCSFVTSNQSIIFDPVPTDTDNVKPASEIYFKVAVGVLTVFFAISLAVNYFHRKKFLKMKENQNKEQDFIKEKLEIPIGIEEIEINIQLDKENDTREPLVPKHNNDETEHKSINR